MSIVARRKRRDARSEKAKRKSDKWSFGRLDAGQGLPFLKKSVARESSMHSYTSA